MHLQLDTDQYIVLRGTHLDRNAEKAKAAYEAAEKKFKFKPDNSDVVTILETDDGLLVSIEAGGKTHSATYKKDKLVWGESTKDAEPAK